MLDEVIHDHDCVLPIRPKVGQVTCPDPRYPQIAPDELHGVRVEIDPFGDRAERSEPHQEVAPPEPHIENWAALYVDIVKHFADPEVRSWRHSQKMVGIPWRWNASLVRPVVRPIELGQGLLCGRGGDVVYTTYVAMQHLQAVWADEPCLPFSIAERAFALLKLIRWPRRYSGVKGSQFGRSWLHLLSPLPSPQNRKRRLPPIARGCAPSRLCARTG